MQVSNVVIRISAGSLALSLCGGRPRICDNAPMDLFPAAVETPPTTT